MSFARILRSSALMGGAQVATLAVAFIRTKIIAQLLGPAGVGLVGILTSFNGNVSTLAAWGLGTSGVRLISAAPEEDKDGKSKAVRHLGGLLALAGLVGTAVLFWPVTLLTFDTTEYAPALFIAGLAVPCIVINTAWSAVLQASGQVKSLAKVQVISAVIGLIVGVPLILLWGTIGIALSLLLAAVATTLFTAYAVRQLGAVSAQAARRSDLDALIKMGGGLVVIGVAVQLATYAVRLAIIRHAGVDLADGLVNAGYYQAAVAIAASLPALVFNAMGTDFFPLVAAAEDETTAKRLTERQIQAGLLLALPLFTGMVTMAQLGINLLYAAKFEPATPLLVWMIWGVFFRLLGWPLGYWLVARGSMRTVVLIEVASNVIMAAVPIILLPWLGLVGAAIGYFVGYVIYTVTMILVARKRSGQWLCRRTLGYFMAAGAWLLSAQIFMGFAQSQYWGIIPTLFISIICILLYRKALAHAETNA